MGFSGRQRLAEREQGRVVLRGHCLEIGARGPGGELPVQLPRAARTGQGPHVGVGVGEVVQIGPRQPPREFPVRHLDRQHECRRQRFQRRLFEARRGGREHGLAHAEDVLHRLHAPLDGAQRAGVDAGHAHHHALDAKAWPMQQEHVPRQGRTLQGAGDDGQGHARQGRAQRAQVAQRQPRGQRPVVHARIVAPLVDHPALQLDRGEVLHRDGGLLAGGPVGVDHGDLVGQFPPLRALEAFHAHDLVGAQERQALDPVIVAQELELEAAPFRVEVEDAADVVEHLGDEGLDRLLARPDQVQAEAFGVERPGRVPEARAQRALRIAHAPVRVGEALHQDVGRVHADGERGAGVGIPGPHLGVPGHPGFVVPARREAPHPHRPGLEVGVVRGEQDLACHDRQHPAKRRDGRAQAAHQVVVAVLRGTACEHVEVTHHAAFAFVAAEERGPIDGEAPQPVAARERRAARIAPGSAIADLDLLHRIHRPLAQHQVHADAVAVADGLLLAAAAHQRGSS
ncbi:hypothetical protein R76727_03046 [Ralstonia mannitolilytica]|nr:hypothetical protein R76727_03046 [Ralstonia mannitolilytica]